MAIKPLTLINGTVADANDVEAIFAPLYADIAPINVQPVNKVGTGAFVLESALVDATFPVGSVIGFADYGGLVSFDTNFWRYLDGSVLNAPGSPLDGVTLQDASGRYLVGFGTDGGGDIGGAPWNPGQIGNTNNLVNLSHSHTVNSHSHTVSNHTHGPGSLEFGVAVGQAATQRLTMFTNNGGTQWIIIDNTVSQKAFGALDTAFFLPQDRTYTTFGGFGVSGSGGAGNTGNSSPGTSNALGNTDVQPTSIRMRWIIRIN